MARPRRWGKASATRFWRGPAALFPKVVLDRCATTANWLPAIDFHRCVRLHVTEGMALALCLPLPNAEFGVQFWLRLLSENDARTRSPLASPPMHVRAGGCTIIAGWKCGGRVELFRAFSVQRHRAWADGYGSVCCGQTQQECGENPQAQTTRIMVALEGRISGIVLCLSFLLGRALRQD